MFFDLKPKKVMNCFQRVGIFLLVNAALFMFCAWTISRVPGCRIRPWREPVFESMGVNAAIQG